MNKMWNCVFGTEQRPENLDKFNIPVLVKKEHTNYNQYGTSTSRYTTYHDAFTDGFFFRKGDKRYFHVQLPAKIDAAAPLCNQPKYEAVYMSENDLVFVKDARDELREM